METHSQIPGWDDKTKNFVYAGEVKDIWYCLLSLEHYFQDYNRIPDLLLDVPAGQPEHFAEPEPKRQERRQ